MQAKLTTPCQIQVEIQPMPSIDVSMQPSKSLDVSISGQLHTLAPYGLKPKFITFYDPFGNIIASYDEQEVDQIKTYPQAPDYYQTYRLRHVGWSDTMEEIHAGEALDVVARYESDTDKCYLNLPYEKEIEVYMSGMYHGYDVHIDWHDGSPQGTYHIKDGRHIYHTYQAGKQHFEIRYDMPKVYQTYISVDRETAIYVVGYICNKDKRYEGATPIRVHYSKEFSNTSPTYYLFNRMQFIIHAYKNNTDNKPLQSYSTCLYPYVAVNDMKGIYSSHNNNGYFYGKVFKEPLKCNITEVNNVRIGYIKQYHINQTPQGKIYCPYYDAEYIYWRDNDLIDWEKMDYTLRFGTMHMFENNYKLTSFAIPKEVKVIGVNAFKNCRSLHTIIWGGQEEEILDSAFYLCSSLREVRMPNTVKKIGDRAFRDTSCNVYIHDGIEDIDSEAFYGNLEYFCYIQDPDKCILRNISAFTKAYAAKGTIHIPKGTIELYKKATNWSALSDRYVDDL